MGFDESGRGGGQPLGIRQRDVGWIPTRSGADAVRVLQRGEEFMSQERIASSPEPIPLLWIELIDALMDSGSWRRLRQECFSTSRASR